MSNQNQNKIKIYPNPTQNVINVAVDNALIGSNYVIFDNIGKVILNGLIYTESTAIDLGSFSNGLYLLRVGENYKNSFKVIKE